MTNQLELDRVLAAFLATGTDELADRVIDAALDQIDHTPQRHAIRLPRRFPTMTMFTRLAAAAVIGVIAIGGALYLLQRNQSTIGTASPTPALTAGPTGLPGTPSPIPAAAGRQIHTATPLLDGRVLVAGGFDSADRALASAELYDPRTNTFTATGSLAEARGWHTATRLADGRVLIVGGGPPSWVLPARPFLSSAELYDPTTGTFSVTGSMATARSGNTATLLLDGRVLVAGGNDRQGNAVATAEIYDPATGKFTVTGSMGTARGFHTATRLADGRVLITGGDPAAWDAPGPYFATAEIYDPATGKFTATGSMAEGRELHAATLLVDGRVLVTGGVTDAGPAPSLASAEIYDPATGKFTATGPMAVRRSYQTSTLLADGRVLIAGGLEHGRAYQDNPQFLASAELYDPTTGTFVETGSMTIGRVSQGASLLADGRVLITAGAVDSSVTTVGSSEIYDPTTGTFSSAG